MSLSDDEKKDLFKCIKANTVMLGRVDERLKSGEKKFKDIEIRLRGCEQTTSSIKTLTKAALIIAPFLFTLLGTLFGLYYEILK